MRMQDVQPELEDICAQGQLPLVAYQLLGNATCQLPHGQSPSCSRDFHPIAQTLLKAVKESILKDRH